MAPSGFQICNLSGHQSHESIITMMKELIKMKAQADQSHGVNHQDHHQDDEGVDQDESSSRSKSRSQSS